ncbi:acyl transferase/acyl hydrolase/lysophospholipase [Lipomyces oligophaga]|uniref:acyl transferase/acyl hydrolase/lysophospholipase n=1 Tax=Lipomyces oligophaga TaxID=45792 RepID=UPI0034CFB8F4
MPRIGPFICSKKTKIRTLHRYTVAGSTAVLATGLSYFHNSTILNESPFKSNSDRAQTNSKTRNEKTEISSVDNIKSQVQQIQERIGDSTFTWDDLFNSMKDGLSTSISFANNIADIQKLFDFNDPNSLGSEIAQETFDPTVNPEISWPAYVRLGHDLCPQEEKFLQRRRQFTKASLAKYLAIDEDSIDDRDIPTIAVTGSGGGLRAMIGTAGYFNSLQSTGLLDCVTYTAGVSGSTWMLALLYTLAEGDTSKLIEHAKARVQTHIAFFPAFTEMVVKPATDKYVISGIVNKLVGRKTSIRMADIYGVLLSSRLLVPELEKIVRPSDLKLSNQRRITDTGVMPLPIYTAVRHELGLTEEEQTSVDQQINSDEATEKAESLARQSRFQWFEFTPYETGSEEIEAWIPTWGLGREYKNGMSVGAATPELSLSLLLGTFGSAFCATLNHLVTEVRPILGDVVGGWLDSMVSGNEEDLKGLHPIKPATIPNYVLGLSGSLPESCPPSLHASKEIEFMDAGMDNNLAFYPLLRPERKVDMIIAFDCSAHLRNVKWLELAAGYSKQRGILGWPVDAAWPESSLNESNINKESTEELKKQTSKTKSLWHSKDAKPQAKSLGPVSIWTGLVEDNDTNELSKLNDRSGILDEEYHLSHPKAGITLVYCPLLPNEKVPGVDPDTSPYMSTWNFIYTPEEVENVRRLAQENFREGEQRVQRAVRLIYERKRKARMDSI